MPPMKIISNTSLFPPTPNSKLLFVNIQKIFVGTEKNDGVTVEPTQKNLTPQLLERIQMRTRRNVCACDNNEAQLREKENVAQLIAATETMA